ncbi:MAG: hypothetical protein WAN65_08100 [Candidatus Sulfotelmatobacter sp.]|nr:hypothetical protein [Candidatus Dormibacteraeota bacterium]
MKRAFAVALLLLSLASAALAEGSGQIPPTSSNSPVGQGKP